MNPQARALRALESVMDPEIPVLSVLDLGVIRSVAAHGSQVRVETTPTYTGCPATRVIRRAIADALAASGFENVEIIEVLDPPWSPDNLAPEARAKLEDYGIAPPARRSIGPPLAIDGVGLTSPGAPRRCPRCHGSDTECVSEFGSTPCKALYRCRGCGEPFDYFKCL